MHPSQTPSHTAEREEEELITVANAPICEMDFSYQALSEELAHRGRGRMAAADAGLFTRFFNLVRPKHSPQPSMAVLFGN